MQAIVETLFDAVYLISVIGIGVLMIRGSKGERQFCLFGWMAVVLGVGDSFHLVPRLCAVYYRSGELYRSSGPWKVDYLGDDDDFLCAALLCLAAEVQDRRPGRPYCRRVWSGRCADRIVHDAAESVVQRRSAAFLGHLPQYSLRAAGYSGDRAVLPQCKGA